MSTHAHRSTQRDAAAMVQGGRVRWHHPLVETRYVEEVTEQIRPMDLPVIDCCEWRDLLGFSLPSNSLTDEVSVDDVSMEYGGYYAYAAAPQLITVEDAPGHHYVIDWSLTYVGGETNPYGATATISLAIGAPTGLTDVTWAVDAISGWEFMSPTTPGTWSGSEDFYAVVATAGVFDGPGVYQMTVRLKANGWAWGPADGPLAYGTMHVREFGAVVDNISSKPGLTTVAIFDPIAINDSDHGYLVGVHWINTTSDEEFVLVDDAVGAAVWMSTTVVGVGGGSFGDMDGGIPSSTYGGITPIDAGGP